MNPNFGSTPDFDNSNRLKFCDGTCHRPKLQLIELSLHDLMLET